MAQLAREGILTSVMLMPVLPFLEDSEENVLAVARSAYQAGASYPVGAGWSTYVVASFGMTLPVRAGWST